MNYLLKFKFTTLKAGRGNGQFIGNGGNGECDIQTELTLSDLLNKKDELKSVAFHSLKANPKVVKMGSIQSIDIIDVVAR